MVRPTECRSAARSLDRNHARRDITFQNAPDLEAQRASAGTAGWAGALMRYGFPIIKAAVWHGTTLGCARAARRAQSRRMLAAVFVPALLRSRAADGLARCTGGSVPRRRASTACSLR